MITIEGKLKTAVFTDIGKLKVEEFDIPDIPKNKVLVKINSCGICTWEQRVYRGVKKVDFPFVGGHEMSGTIEALGEEVDKNNWKMGDRVVIGVMLPCKQCYQCKSGNEQNCEHFNHTKEIEGLPYKGMGGLSSHFIASPDNLFKFHDISDEEATIAEPLSCVVHSVETADIQLGDTVMVIGCGIMGLLHIILSVKKGASVIASDINDKRLELALKLGAKHIINPSKIEQISSVKEITRGEKVQVIFDTTPISELVEEACKLLANNGRLVLYSSFYPDKPITLSPDWIHKSAVRIMGTANSNTRDFVKAVRLLSEGIVPVKDFISEVYKLEDIDEAFQSAIKGDKYRVIVKI